MKALDNSIRRSRIVSGPRESLLNTPINDDEAERREARRRTLLQSAQSLGNNSTLAEASEALNKYLEIYNCNKLSRENAWSMSVIDTLSTLLERHHNSLNNFKVASSSLEASTKVYSLRVDSVHTDVLRMAAGFNAQKFSEKSLLDDDEEDAEGVVGDPSAEAQAPSKPKQKRQRRIAFTVTKNKETLNARLETIPLQDPVFAKLNSTVGSVNSSNRLMNNILLTEGSELLLRTNFTYFDPKDMETETDYCEETQLDEESEMIQCGMILKLKSFDHMAIRPEFGGYVISDTPEEDLPDDDKEGASSSNNVEEDGHFDDPLSDGQAMSMAFDLNAECEPLPENNEQMIRYDDEIGNFDEMTVEDRTAINRCRYLRQQPVVIEDLRPTDASSKLEYSYRPLDKISQFWAGPSHWKFKRHKPRSSSIAGNIDNATATKALNQRAKRAQQRKLQQSINFHEEHPAELYIESDEHLRTRKVNFNKKWDQRKLKLPTDLKLGPTILFNFSLAPGIDVNMNHTNDVEPYDDGDSLPADFGGDHDDVDEGVGMLSSPWPQEVHERTLVSDGDQPIESPTDCDPNQTVLEIPTHNEGAPTQVQKVIVPFAKRAKVIDMKLLKKSCFTLVSKGLQKPVDEGNVPVHPIIKDEPYKGGAVSFKEVYDHLPELLPHNMAENMSITVAFYSVLHLSNEFNLRLIPQEDMRDFFIRQIDDSIEAADESMRPTGDAN